MKRIKRNLSRQHRLEHVIKIVCVYTKATERESKAWDMRNVVYRSYEMFAKEITFPPIYLLLSDSLVWNSFASRPHYEGRNNSNHYRSERRNLTTRIPLKSAWKHLQCRETSFRICLARNWNSSSARDGKTFHFALFSKPKTEHRIFFVYRIQKW